MERLVEGEIVSLCKSSNLSCWWTHIQTSDANLLKTVLIEM